MGFFMFTGRQFLPLTTRATDFSGIDRHADYHCTGDHENGYGAARQAKNCSQSKSTDNVNTIQFLSRSHAIPPLLFPYDLESK